MSDGEKKEVNVEKMLEDDVITNAVWCQLTDDFAREQETERVINGPLSMVCTYPEGYKERQSLYACRTCAKETGQVAGICFACSENCHKDHDLIQLYTKRNFCCDCGNSKFKSKCKLFEEKIAVNRKNTYSHNFIGEYCTCNKPYPPPDDDPMYESEMSQCVMCEDWFHEEHLGLEEGVFEEDGVEIVCAACADKFSFLRTYSAVYEREFIRANGPLGGNQTADETVDRTTTTIDGTTNESTLDESTASAQVPPSTAMFTAPTAAAAQSTADDLNASTASTRRRQLVIIDNRGTENSPAADCYFRQIQAEEAEQPKAEGAKAGGSLWFATCDWRMMLCRCGDCKRMYEDRECEFLLDEVDTLTHYLNANAAELEKNRREPEEELFDEVAKRSNADVAHTVVAEMAVMKRKLTEFIVDMAAKDKTITDTDVHAFFDDLNAKRRRLNEPKGEE